MLAVTPVKQSSACKGQNFVHLVSILTFNRQPPALKGHFSLFLELLLKTSCAMHSTKMKSEKKSDWCVFKLLRPKFVFLQKHCDMLYVFCPCFFELTVALWAF